MIIIKNCRTVDKTEYFIIRKDNVRKVWDMEEKGMIGISFDISYNGRTHIITLRDKTISSSNYLINTLFISTGITIIEGELVS